MSRQSRIDATENVNLSWRSIDNPVAPPPIPPARRAHRASVNVPVELLLRGRSFPGQIHSLSRFGAFVRCGFAFHAGDVVSIVLTRPAQVVTRALVIHHIGDADAERLGTVTGVGLRFRDPMTDADAAFARTIGALLAPGGREG